MSICIVTTDDSIVQGHENVWLWYVTYHTAIVHGTSLTDEPIVAVLLLSATVLGLSAYLASVFLPDIRRMSILLLLGTYPEFEPRFSGDFSIFSIVVPSLTILGFLVMCVYSVFNGRN